MLHVILLDSAIELVPTNLTSTKLVQKHASRRGKKPNQLLLDQSHHGQVMTKLEDANRRGRPDIAFLCLMALLETPLCKQGLLTIHLHLQNGQVIEVNPSVRLPRNYDRFVGLLEQLLLRGRVPPDGESLLRVRNESLPEIISQLRDANTQNISALCVEGGTQTTIDGLEAIFPEDGAVPVILGVGAFPHGDLSKEVKTLFQTHIELDPEVMMAWHVCAEVLWVYSLKMGVVKTRYAP
ncbi:MAG: 16S rRNA methyltransferase [Candidatus Thorarchaeota archaeon]|jgi:rRNA small subunit pseudouridine methyltransferase Nep1